MNTTIAQAVEARPVRIGLFGQFQSGKSLLVNCLLGEHVAQVGEGHATTRWITTYRYGKSERAVVLTNEQQEFLYAFKTVGEFINTPSGTIMGLVHEKDRTLQLANVTVTLDHEPLRFVELVDIPGINHDNHDDAKALDALNTLDVALFVQCEVAFNEPKIAFLKQIATAGKPCVILRNCTKTSMGNWNPNSDINRQFHGELKEQAKKDAGLHVYTLGESSNYNFLWAWLARFVGEAELDRELAREEFKHIASSVSFYFRGAEALGEARAAAMRSRSRVDEIQRFVSVEPARAVGMNAYCLGTLHRAARAWSEKAQQQIQQIKQTISN